MCIHAVLQQSSITQWDQLNLFHAFVLNDRPDFNPRHVNQINHVFLLWRRTFRYWFRTIKIGGLDSVRINGCIWYRAWAGGRRVTTCLAFNIFLYRAPLKYLFQCIMWRFSISLKKIKSFYQVFLSC